MNDTQVAALDHTIQETNTWLKKLAGDTISAIDPTCFAQCCTFCATASRQNKLFIWKASVSPANRQTNDSPTNSRSAWRPNCPRSFRATR